MTQAHDLGRKAEALATGFLQKSGYALLARNYRCLKSELDLIVQKENIVVGVEVKARTVGFVLAAYEAVSYNKIQLLVTTMDHFVQSKNMDVEVRFDLITYVFKGDDWEQDHIEDAFCPFG